MVFRFQSSRHAPRAVRFLRGFVGGGRHAERACYSKPAACMQSLQIRQCELGAFTRLAELEPVILPVAKSHLRFLRAASGMY